MDRRKDPKVQEKGGDHKKDSRDVRDVDDQVKSFLQIRRV
jgi:hypothetical protein